jgi:hypothetical protein
MIAIEIDLISTVKTLPNSSVTKIYGVSWEEYESLVGKMEEFPAHRVWFDEGKLIITTPRTKIEKPKIFFSQPSTNIVRRA